MTLRPDLRSEALRDLVLAVGFGLLSWALARIRFDLPGFQGHTDLREVGLLLAAFHLRRPWAVVLAAGGAAVSHPPGLFLDGFLIHAIAGWLAWAVVRVLRRRISSALALGAAWAAFVVLGYYALALLPMILVAGAVAGHQAWSKLPWLYLPLFRSITFEVVATASLTALALMNLRHLLQLKDSRDRLQASEARLAGILAAVPVGIAAVEAGRIVWANERLTGLVGRPPGGLLGTPASAVLHGSDGSALGITSLLEAADGGTASAELELQVANGGSIAVLVHAAPRPGPLPAHTLSILDISERNRLERQFRHAQKMEALGQVSGSVAHDFGNLLQALQLSAHLMREQVGKGGSPEGLLGTMEHTLEQGRRVVHQLLAFSRRQPSKPGPLDLSLLVRQNAPMLQTLVGRQVHLKVENAGRLPDIEADTGQVEQVLVNLVINARDAILAREGGAPDLRVTVVPSDPARGEAEGQVVLEVEDSGIGMSDETRARMFEPFFTTKPEGKGSGLGLATVYGIVQGHGATLTVNSEPGRGTNFRIAWPAAVGPREGVEA